MSPPKTDFARDAVVAAAGGYPASTVMEKANMLTFGLASSAPNRAYPASTHVPAVAAHLVFGIIVLAAVVEGAWQLAGD